MPINTHTKGQRAMLEARKYAEKNGYEVIQAPHGRFDKDWFGLWDQIWLKKTALIFVQVRHRRPKMQPFSDWCAGHYLSGLICVRRPKKIMEMFLISPKGEVSEGLEVKLGREKEL